MFSQQHKFKELYGVCVLQEVQVGRKMKHCTMHTAIKMRVHCSRVKTQLAGNVREAVRHLVHLPIELLETVLWLF